jgi:hypothetical protein
MKNVLLCLKNAHMLYNTDIIKEYINISEAVYKLFTDKRIEHKPFYEKMGMNRLAFSRRIKGKSFTAQELLSICELINQFFDYGQVNKSDIKK